MVGAYRRCVLPPPPPTPPPPPPPRGPRGRSPTAPHPSPLHHPPGKPFADFLDQKILRIYELTNLRCVVLLPNSYQSMSTAAFISQVVLAAILIV
jgi:hypothetical protein